MQAETLDLGWMAQGDVGTLPRLTGQERTSLPDPIAPAPLPVYNGSRGTVDAAPVISVKRECSELSV